MLIVIHSTTEQKLKSSTQNRSNIHIIIDTKDLGKAHPITSLKNSALPIVEINVVLNASSENLNKTHVLPTPESPIKSNLNK
jgi:hypothetical protein